MRLLLSEIGGLVANSLGFDDFPLLGWRAAVCRLRGLGTVMADRCGAEGRVDHFRRQFAQSDLPLALPTDHPRTGHAGTDSGRQFAFDSRVGRGRRRARWPFVSRRRCTRCCSPLSPRLWVPTRTANGGARSARDPPQRASHPADARSVHEHRAAADRPEDDAGLPALVRGVKTAVLGALSNQDAPWHHVRRSADGTARTNAPRHRRD